MRQHVLLEKAYCYPEPGEAQIPGNCTFIRKSGYWRNNSTGGIMMLSSDLRRPQAKKADIEARGDQKSE